MTGWIVIVPADGGLRSLNEDFTSSQRAAISHIVGRALRGEGDPAPPVPPPPVLSGAEVGLTQGEIARDKGYTGDACTDCGSFNMRRSGTCATCESCGSTTGCS